MAEQQLGPVLLHRTWLVRVHGLSEDGEVDIEYVFDDLDIDFDIYKTLRPEPNRGSITLYNLTAEQRKSIERLNLYDKKKLKGSKTKREAGRTAKTGKAGAPRKPKVGRISVEVEAGYETTGNSLIWRGDLRRATTSKNGASFVTKIDGEDAGRSIVGSRINESFPAGTTLLTVVKACCAALGIGEGNLLAFSRLLSATFTHGAVADGNAAKELSSFLRRAGLVYSAQAGVLQVRKTTVGSEDVVTAYVLNEDTGLVGIPERDPSGMVQVTCLLLPQIAPGGFVTLESDVFKGTYEIVAIKYSGSTRGNSWYAELELSPV